MIEFVLYTLILAPLSFMGGAGFTLFCGICIQFTSYRGQLPVPVPSFIPIPERLSKTPSLPKLTIWTLQIGSTYLSPKGIVTITDVWRNIRCAHIQMNGSSKMIESAEIEGFLGNLIPLEDGTMPIMYEQYRYLKEIGLA